MYIIYSFMYVYSLIEDCKCLFHLDIFLSDSSLFYRRITTVWLGYSNSSAPQWQWADGGNQSFPSASASSVDGAECAIINGYVFQEWKAESCSAKHHVVCQTKPSGTTLRAEFLHIHSNIYVLT